MRKNTILDALFPRTRQNLLASTVLHPERWWYLSDLARHLGVTPSSLQRELASLVGAGILVRRQEGRLVYFRPDPRCPILAELQSMLVKTAGLADVLRGALAPAARALEVAFIYGSIARAEELSESDVDVLIVGDTGLADLAPALRDAERQLGRPVNPTLYSRQKTSR